jgi:50S ribosomal protein L16 3-hydroxylase
MDLTQPLALLGGLSPAQFMRRHWQKRPLLVRQAWPGVGAPLPRAQLFALAARDDVESRLVQRAEGGRAPAYEAAAWQVRQGPLPRRALPPLSQPGWTLLVQGLDLHVPEAHKMLQAFRFLPAARLDDLMVSWASDGGGVGPHLDSYDVFLLQVQGARRWRIGPVKGERAATTVDGAPLKLLRHFEPSEEWLLQPGDMLYLPPRWGHDGVAEGECMTCSIGFRAPQRERLAAELLQRIADAASDEAEACNETAAIYRDPQQPATLTPAAVPAALQDYAQRAVARLLSEPGALDRALGEALTEPKAQVWFEARADAAAVAGTVALVLDAATRMLYDARFVFINGESYRAGGRDARLMHQLADARRLGAAAVARLSPEARGLLSDWQNNGWVHAAPAVEEGT